MGRAARRGAPEGEYRARLARAQAMMAEAELSALLLTTEPEIRYFTGFLTRFWESPTRPWFLIVPSSGLPIAVIPEIGAYLMGQGWIEDIRTWHAPDYGAEGVDLVADALTEHAGPDNRIGLPDGPETHLRLPLSALDCLRTRLGTRQMVGDAGILRRLRLVKSPGEIDKITMACRIAGRAFDRVGEIAHGGVPLDAVFRRFQMLCLEEGADWVGYLAGAAGLGGYGDVISPASPDPLQAGDVLMLDTGVVWDGYYCDFDRNYSVGPAAPDVAAAHARLMDATEAGFSAARPGQTAADLHAAMENVLAQGLKGRFGHGLGMQLTEWPSILPMDRTVLEPGMVITLEPVLETATGKILVHEEDVVITETGARWLTEPAARDLFELEVAR